MTLIITQVDAFTNHPFCGNPAAVCVLEKAGDEAWMQAVAREMNLSETAFLVPRTDGYDLRWFTPAVEVDLCGHATLAAAHVLWESGALPADEEARFHSHSGLLKAKREGDWIYLDFPATPAADAQAPPALVNALGVTPLYTGKSALGDYLIEVDSEATVRATNPDFGLLAKVPARGVMVTSLSSDAGFDFVSRFFAPRAGINEDPVTGSAHCCLGPYWEKRLGKKTLLAFQASARGGCVRVRVEDDRVVLGGQAVTVLRGELVPES